MTRAPRFRCARRKKVRLGQTARSANAAPQPRRHSPPSSRANAPPRSRKGARCPTRSASARSRGAFGLKGADRIPLKRILKELEAEGAVEKRGRTLHKKGQLPSVVLADITGRDADGELVARPVEWNEEEHGAAPRIAVFTPRKSRPGQPAAGVGDRALIRVEPNRDARKGEPQYDGPRRQAAREDASRSSSACSRRCRRAAGCCCPSTRRTSTAN